MLTDLNCIIKNDLFYFIREKFKFIIFVQLGLSLQNVPLDTVISVNTVKDCNLFLLFLNLRAADKSLVAPEWTWHVFSQITTNLFSYKIAIITL
jgi:hypothetical protein